MSARRHAPIALPHVARAISRDVMFSCTVLLALLCGAAGATFGAVAIALLLHGDVALAGLSVVAAAISVIASRSSQHLSPRLRARDA